MTGNRRMYDGFRVVVTLQYSGCSRTKSMLSRAQHRASFINACINNKKIIILREALEKRISQNGIAYLRKHVLVHEMQASFSRL